MGDYCRPMRRKADDGTVSKITEHTTARLLARFSTIILIPALGFFLVLLIVGLKDDTRYTRDQVLQQGYKLERVGEDVRDMKVVQKGLAKEQNEQRIDIEVIKKSIQSPH